MTFWQLAPKTMQRIPSIDDATDGVHWFYKCHQLQWCNRWCPLMMWRMPSVESTEQHPLMRQQILCPSSQQNNISCIIMTAAATYCPSKGTTSVTKCNIFTSLTIEQIRLSSRQNGIHRWGNRCCACWVNRTALVASSQWM